MLSCGASKIAPDATYKVRFLDEYIIPENFEVEGTKVGGLSDLDYDGEDFYAIVDQPSSPRIYRFVVEVQENKIDSIRFKEVININRENPLARNKVWDSEGILFDSFKKQFILSSEGAIAKGQDPFIAEINRKGESLNFYELPKYFKANAKNGLRDNGAFEGLTKSVDEKSIWVGTELPMKRDGQTVKLYHTSSPIRITRLDRRTKKANQQFVYELDRLRKVPFLPLGMNGVSALLEYEKDQFFVVERAFSAGHRSRGLRVRLYDVDASHTTNTLTVNSLRKKVGRAITPAKKRLIFDFNKVRKNLTNKSIDNIEGMAFGPTLPNGNQSLILIADNNFSSWMPQQNQVILLELIPQKKYK